MRRGGSKSSNELIPDQGQATRAIPQYSLLDDAALAAIERQADWILANVGMEFRGDTEAVRLFKAAGADVTDERVRLEPGMARALCSTAPSSFQLVARDPKQEPAEARVAAVLVLALDAGEEGLLHEVLAVSPELVGEEARDAPPVALEQLGARVGVAALPGLEQRLIT